MLAIHEAQPGSTVQTSTNVSIPLSGETRVTVSLPTACGTSFHEALPDRGQFARPASASAAIQAQLRVAV